MLLLAAAALAVVLLVERWLAVERPGTRLTAFVVAAALLGTFGLVLAGVLCAVSLMWRRAPASIRRPLATAARLTVPVLLVAFAVYTGLDLVRTASAIL